MTIAPERVVTDDIAVTTTPRMLDLAARRTLLLGLFLELSGELDEGAAAAQSLAEHGRGGEDEVDVGSRAAQREQQLTVLASITARRAQVERALERVEHGSYGRCERCDNAIPTDRLTAFPWVTNCVTCKRADERRS